MICKSCGKEIPNNSTVCPECGAKLAENNGGDNALQVVAWVFMLINTILSGFFLIPLCWTIPMTVHLRTHMNKGKKTGLGFQICTLLFVSLVSGILLLIDGHEE